MWDNLFKNEIINLKLKRKNALRGRASLDVHKGSCVIAVRVVRENYILDMNIEQSKIASKILKTEIIRCYS